MDGVVHAERFRFILFASMELASASFERGKPCRMMSAGRTVCFIRPVSAVVVSVTAPRLTDASTAGALKLVLRARVTLAVMLVTAIAAVCVPVAAPAAGDAAIGAGKIVGVAGVFGFGGSRTDEILRRFRLCLLRGGIGHAAVLV